MYSWPRSTKQNEFAFDNLAKWLRNHVRRDASENNAHPYCRDGGGGADRSV
jgi:hypothetical protein